MKWRSFVVVMAVILAASSIAFCVEEIETTVEEVNQLLAAAGKMIEEGKLDVADKVLDDAVKRYYFLTDEDKARVDKAIVLLPFDMAEKCREHPGDTKADALKWYDAYASLKLYGDTHRGLEIHSPFFRYQQTKYSYVLGMAAARCDGDPRKVKSRYPGIAGSWAPFVCADIDGDGDLEVIADNAEPWGKDRTVLNVFFLAGDGAPDAITFMYEYYMPLISASDADGDGKEEIYLRNHPRSHSLGMDRTTDPSELKLRWYQATITVEYEDGKLVDAGMTVQTWDKEPTDYPK